MNGTLTINKILILISFLILCGSAIGQDASVSSLFTKYLGDETQTEDPFAQYLGINVSVQVCNSTIVQGMLINNTKDYIEVKKVYPTVSLATVYKTIKILKEFGLIQELNLTQGQTRFDPNTEPHAHLVCLQCGSISDWMDPLIQKLVTRISADASFIVNGSSLDVNGVCKSCNGKSKKIMAPPANKL